MINTSSRQFLCIFLLIFMRLYFNNFINFNNFLLNSYHFVKDVIHKR